ncbi:MAG: sulfurtransferase complex subunit TusC [Gammaproteobacteria bacterium]|nr:sulfurtransferase complex subunit TusC [Gammaproteobacteria bacterium]
MTERQSKSLTFISRRPPYGSDNALACLDLVLASAVFEQNVNYLFMGDGVFQLLKSQQSEGIESKNVMSLLLALPIYGVENVFVDDLSLHQRNLSLEDLAIKTTLLNSQQVRQLVLSADVVFNL